MFQYPYGDTQQLNLDWLMEQWQETKASIDGSLQGEIDRVEAAITELLTARDQAVAAKTAAETAATAASGYAGTASGAASTATAQATAAAASAALAGSKASDAQTAETNAALQATAAANSAAAAAVSKTNAGNSETAAAASSSAAAGNALYAEGMAKGTQNGTPVTSGSPYYEDNAAYWAGEAQGHAGAAVAAAYYSEAMAKGTVDGTPVSSGDPGYEDNAEYYKDQAAAQAAAAAASAASADGTNAQKMIAAPEEATSTASAAHAAGTYFRYNSKLYKATQDIALGGTITPNTNCVEDTVCAELTAQSEQIGELKTAFDKYLIEITYNNTLTAHETDKYMNNSGVASVYNGFAYSELIPVKKGDLINANLACPSSFYAIWYGTDGYATKEYAVAGTGWAADDLTLISDRDGYIFCNYYYSQPHTLKVTHYTMPDVQEAIEEIEETIEDTILPVDYSDTIPTHEAGKYLTISTINTWDFYSYSDVIPVTKGDTVSITAYVGPNIYGYYCDSDFLFRQNAFVGDTYGVKTYTFIADRTAFLAINFATEYTHTIKIVGNTPKQLAYTNPLLDKTVVWCGDSIMRGNAFNDAMSGWAGRCASMSSFHFRNYGTGGSTICNNVSGGATPTIYTQIETAYSEYPDADYIIFDGGCNDADLIGSALGSTLPAQFGTWNPTDWSGSYDTDTFCGAFETICMNLSKHWLGSHVGYIVPHKMGVANNYSATGNNYRKYYETAIEICNKWGIPVLNLWDGCYLNPKHNWMCDTDNTMTQEEIYAAGFLYGDRQHLTSEGYDFESTLVAEWLKSL